ncbi:hypothetical protein Tco_1358140 [Tanacetum coccineum]
MHIYWASVFILPSSLMLELEQLMRGFLWCQGEMKKGKAKVAWEVAYLPKREGGLGIRRLETLLWEIPIRGKLSWGWRKILQVRQLARPYFWYRLGDGANASAWFDNWCSVSPLADRISNRDIYGAGFNRSAKVWDHMKGFTGLSNIPSDLDSIVGFISLMTKMRSVRSVITKLVFATSCYFIWQERNNGIFIKKKRSKD